MQIPLNIRLRDDATFQNFFVHERVQAAFDATRDSCEPLVFLHGPEEAGKSHLLQGACHACDGVALYLPLSVIADMSPTALLDGVEGSELICLDDLQAIAGDQGWERALFNLYNAAQSSGARLLIAANAPPLALGMVLPDLQSRLSAMLVYGLPLPDESEALQILMARSARRGLAMPEGVARYISYRAGRSLRELMAVLEELDSASLAHQRALSIPFVRTVMGWHGSQLP